MEAFEKVVRQRYSLQIKISKEKDDKPLVQNSINADELRLTEREKQILAFIAAGQNNREIAASLYLSEKTVKTHVTHILRKLKLPDRTKAAIFAIQKGLLKNRT